MACGAFVSDYDALGFSDMLYGQHGRKVGAGAKFNRMIMNFAQAILLTDI